MHIGICLTEQRKKCKLPDLERRYISNERLNIRVLNANFRSGDSLLWQLWQTLNTGVFHNGPASTKSVSSLPPVLCSHVVLQHFFTMPNNEQCSWLWCPTSYTLLFWLAILNMRNTYSPDCGGKFLCRRVAYICSTSEYLTSALQGFAFENSPVDVHGFTSEGFQSKTRIWLKPPAKKVSFGFRKHREVPNLHDEMKKS